MTNRTDRRPRRQPPLWLLEGLEIVQRRRRLLLGVAALAVLASAVVAVLAPTVLVPRALTGAGVGLGSLLLGAAATIAADATDLVVRGPRHVRAAGGELVAVLPTVASPQRAVPLADAIRDARPDDGTPLRVALAATGRHTEPVSALADAVAVALADDVNVLRIDLASGAGTAPGLVEVMLGDISLGKASDIAAGRHLARLGPGSDVTSALAALPALATSLPRDLDVLVVALPAASSRQVVAAVTPLDHVLVVVERDRTSRVELIAGLDAVEAAGTAAQVVLLDDVTAEWLAGSASGTAHGTVGVADGPGGGAREDRDRGDGDAAGDADPDRARSEDGDGEDGDGVGGPARAGRGIADGAGRRDAPGVGDATDNGAGDEVGGVAVDVEGGHQHDPAAVAFVPDAGVVPTPVADRGWGTEASDPGGDDASRVGTDPDTGDDATSRVATDDDAGVEAAPRIPADDPAAAQDAADEAAPAAQDDADESAPTPQDGAAGEAAPAAQDDADEAAPTPQDDAGDDDTTAPRDGAADGTTSRVGARDEASAPTTEAHDPAHQGAPEPVRADARDVDVLLDAAEARAEVIAETRPPAPDDDPDGAAWPPDDAAAGQAGGVGADSDGGPASSVGPDAHGAASHAVESTPHVGPGVPSVAPGGADRADGAEHDPPAELTERQGQAGPTDDAAPAERSGRPDQIVRPDDAGPTDETGQPEAHDRAAPADHPGRPDQTDRPDDVGDTRDTRSADDTDELPVVRAPGRRHDDVDEDLLRTTAQLALLEMDHPRAGSSEPPADARGFHGRGGGDGGSTDPGPRDASARFGDARDVGHHGRRGTDDASDDDAPDHDAADHDAAGRDVPDDDAPEGR